MAELFGNKLFGDTALKAYYRGEDLTDASPNGKTLTKTGTVNNLPAKFNNGFDATFSDSTNHLTNTSVFAPSTGDVTLGCWFKRNGAPAIDFTPTILSLGSADGAIRCTLEATKTNGFFQTQFVNAGSNSATSSTNICDNIFHFLVMVRLSGNVTLYVDGISVATVATSKDISTDDLLIGYSGANSGFDYIGAATIDDVFVFSKALSNSERYSLYLSTAKISNNLRPAIFKPGIAR